MKHVPQRRMKVAHLLTDPTASFVSLVDHGANQVPFSVVKMAGMGTKTAGEDGHAGTPIFNGLEVKAMAGKGNVTIQKITFDKSVFTDEEAVKAYLKKAGIEADIKDEDGLYVVRSEAADEDDAVQVGAEDGVTYSLAKQADEDADDATGDGEQVGKSAEGEEPADASADAEVAKSFLNPELSTRDTVQKFDEFFAAMSASKDISTVLRDGADGLPIGIYELNTAFYTAFRNSLLDGDYVAARAAVTEFGELAIRLAQTIEAAVVGSVEGGDVERANTVKGAIMGTANAEAEGTAQEATEAVDEQEGDGQEPTSKDTVEDGSDTTDVGVDASADDAGTGDAAGDEPVAKAANSEEIGTIVANMMKEAMAPVASALADVNKTMTDGLADVREQVGKAEERVEHLERRSQTRKGAHVDDEVEDTAPAKKGTGQVDALRANTLGFRRRNS